jgi:hypothetical protein
MTIQKFCFVLIFALSIPCAGKAQFEDGDFSMGLSANAIMYTDYGAKTAGGLTMQLFLTDNVSLNSNFQFGPNYVHMPIGMALASLVFLSGDPSGCSNISCNDDDYWAVLLIILFSEGVSFHLPVLNNVVVSPYINPMGVDYWYEPNRIDDSPFLFTFSAGTKLNLFAGENFNFAPYVEYKTIYGQGQPGFGAGVTLNVIVR